MDERPNPLEDRPYAHELGDALRTAVDQVRTEPPPVPSLVRSLDRARRFGPGRVNPWLRYHRTALAAAVAAVLLLATGLLLICWRYEPGTGPRAAAPGGDNSVHGDDGSENNVAVGVDHAADGPAGPAHAGGDGRPAEDAFVDAGREPLSTFPLAMNPAAYRDVRRSLLEEKRLPPADAVRVADLVNSFTYSYPEPTGDEPVSLTLDLAECPWNAAHHLARIGVRAGAGAAVLEARVQVAFNPRRVAAYRLIGNEGRRPRTADAAGESLAGGRAVTALYEVVPAVHPDEAEWLTVKFRCRDRADRPWAIDQLLNGEAHRFAAAPADFRFAAAAAEFGLLLRESEHMGAATYAAVRAAARGAPGADPDGRRAEFLALVDAADQITSQRKLTRRDARSS